MMHVHQDIREKHILGRSKYADVVRADDSDERSWLSAAPVCAELAQHRIVHCGIMHASHPLEIARTHLTGTHFMASFEGEGEVLIDGSWRRVESGVACLQPPFTKNALRAKPRKRWSFCWVRYLATPGVRPIASLHSPAIASYDATALRLAVQGLHSEATGGASPAALSHWAELIHGYTLRFAQPYRGEDRLQKVWKAVERDLARTWTLDRLARLAGVSKEHLRRLTSHSVGRTPMQHISFLRMHHAAHLLATTERTIADIAGRVAFTNPFSFSNTFLRWTGCRPSEFRKRSQEP